MFENLCAVFGAPSDDPHGDRGEEWIAAVADEIVEVPGVRAARHFETGTALGTEAPAGFTRLVFFELDDALDPERSPLVGRVEQLCTTGTDEPRCLSYFCAGLGGHGEVELPDHLYLNFSGQPDFMRFSEYSDWYEEHQAENIANTSALLRGWRFALTPLDTRTAFGPTHLAAYQLVDDYSVMKDDLDAAMASGVVSLPDWFRRFASVEAVALGDRFTRAL